jgi:hypothetical protein
MKLGFDLKHIPDVVAGVVLAALLVLLVLKEFKYSKRSVSLMRTNGYLNILIIFLLILFIVLFGIKIWNLATI